MAVINKIIKGIHRVDMDKVKGMVFIVKIFQDKEAISKGDISKAVLTKVTTLLIIITQAISPGQEDHSKTILITGTQGILNQIIHQTQINDHDYFITIHIEHLS